MGIWLELGIFLLVLIWGIWQIRDARQALAKGVAERKARESAQALSSDGPKPGEPSEARRLDPPA